jgi:hypothetical protein
MPKWRPMNGEGSRGSPFLSWDVELAPQVVCSMSEFKKRSPSAFMWNLAAQKQVCVSTNLHGYFIIE